MPKKRRRRRLKKQVIVGMVVVLLAIVCIISTVFIEMGGANKKMVDLYQHLGIEKGTSQVAMFMNDCLDERKGYVENGHYYFELSFLKENFDEKFYFDDKENVLIYTTPTEVIKASVGSSDYYVSKQKNAFSHDIVKTNGVDVYVSAEFAKLYTPFEIATYNDYNRMVVNNEWKVYEVSTITKDTVLRLETDKKSEGIIEVKKGDTVRIIESFSKWTKVQTSDGYIGYLANNTIGKKSSAERTTDYVPPVYTSITKNYTIEMVWHQVYNMDANDYMVDMTSNSKGITTISPTWFSLNDSEGNFSSLASSSYVNRAHHIGYEVWALLSDFEQDGDGEFYVNKVLPYTSKRESLVNQLVAELIEYDIDGINVDFEFVSIDCAEDYIQFLRELSVKCRINGIVLSIDNYVPADYNMYYDRTEQGILADYVVIMGYDEYNGASTQAGPVASKPFVEKGITDTLAEVPAEKVILGVPFFARVWLETPEQYAESGATIIQDSVKGNYALDSSAYEMYEAEELVEDASATKVWLEELGCYYSEYEVGDSLCRVWLEEERSMEEKLKLMQKNALAGVACWSIGLEKTAIWDTIIKYTN